jgi:hypothetical protein
VWLRAGPEANDHAFADGRQDVARESSPRLHTLPLGIMVPVSRPLWRASALLARLACRNTVTSVSTCDMPFAATTFAFFGLISNTNAASHSPGWASQNDRHVPATPAARSPRPSPRWKYEGSQWPPFHFPTRHPSGVLPREWIVYELESITQRCGDVSARHDLAGVRASPDPRPMLATSVASPLSPACRSHCFQPH